MGSGHGVDGLGKHLADRSVVVVRLILGDLPQRLAELLQRNTEVAAPALRVDQDRRPNP